MDQMLLYFLNEKKKKPVKLKGLYLYLNQKRWIMNLTLKIFKSLRSSCASQLCQYKRTNIGGGENALILNSSPCPTSLHSACARMKTQAFSHTSFLI